VTANRRHFRWLGWRGNNAIPKSIKGEQARRLKQIEPKKEKLARKGHASAKEKREPKFTAN
jgi:hypothetical protein